MELMVLDVKQVQAKVPKLNLEGPQVLGGTVYNNTGPCDKVAPAEALVIPFDKAVGGSSSSGYTIQPFEIKYFVTLKDDVQKSDLLNNFYDDVTWTVLDAPPVSAAFRKAQQSEDEWALHAQPQEGGVYKLQLELCPGSKKTEVFVNLPLASADILNWLDAEAKNLKQWADQCHNAAYAKYAFLKIDPAIEMAIYWNFLRNSSVFDYTYRGQASYPYAPCDGEIKKLSAGSVQNYYVTVNGVVLHTSKMNNFMWVLFSRYWGKSQRELEAYSKSLAFVGGGFDTPSAKKSLELAGDYYSAWVKDNNANVANTLTRQSILSMQDITSLAEEHFWPSPHPVDISKSTFTRPKWEPQ